MFGWFRKPPPAIEHPRLVLEAVGDDVVFRAEFPEGPTPQELQTYSAALHLLVRGKLTKVLHQAVFNAGAVGQGILAHVTQLDGQERIEDSLPVISPREVFRDDD